MNVLQRFVLGFYLVGLVIVGVFWAPWNEVVDTAQATRVRPLGFAPLFDPPAVQASASALGVQLDATRLGVHVIALTLISVVLFFLLGRGQGGPRS